MVDIKLKMPEQFLEPEPKTLIVPAQRKELWAIELDLLAEFDRVCKKHGIKYFCVGGTALGAVRHNGFIPWDDDIDIAMSRPEYEKLNAIASGEFRQPYFWQTNNTDPGSARGHAQLRNSSTTAILKSEMQNGRAIYTFNQGIFIDIFPFDSLPDDYLTREKFKKRLEKLKRAIYRLRYLKRPLKSWSSNLLSISSICRFCASILIRTIEALTGRDFLVAAVRELDSVAQIYNNTGAKEAAPISFMPTSREVIPIKFLDESVEVDFEFLKIPIMSHYLEDLVINYGSNWREHIIGSSCHGGILFDVNKPYTDYLN